MYSKVNVCTFNLIRLFLIRLFFLASELVIVLIYLLLFFKYRKMDG